MNVAPLWTIPAMAATMGAARSGPLPAAVSGISIDSRTLAPGEAFFAIQGETRDGHDFVAHALKAGAGLAVIATGKRASFDHDVPLLAVADVLEALRALAAAARARSQARVIAVTGSVGKTGTKEALRLALAPQGETHASASSYNNHLGVPLSLARCPASARFAVFELGMNHAGEIEPLTRLVRPHLAIITAVEPVHLEFFGSVEAIADAKAEIFLGLDQRGCALINRDSAQFARLKKRADRAGIMHCLTFGESTAADARLLNCRAQPDGTTVEACILGRDITYKLGAPGRHVVLNSLAVLATIAVIGADVRVAAEALAQWRPSRGRGARLNIDVPGGSILLIDESYNANPASMRAALALLGDANGTGGGRRIAVLGDMLELGASAPRLHRDLADAVVACGIDLVFCCGPLMRALWDALPTDRRGSYAPTSAELQSRLLAALKPGDTVMVKGSLGSRMGAIVAAVEHRYRPEALALGRA
jgi:UDP-N-acetylmuramoyl-tripeptide--D-alanyl-D-alanine ligase